MTNQHPITPSPELVEQYMEMFINGLSKREFKSICEELFQKGTDAELEACDALVERLGEMPTGFLTSLRRKSTPQKLKEHALNELQRIEANIPQNIKSFEASCATIRQALEALDDN